MNAKVWYLYHSGFAVQTANHFLVFDYWKQSPKGKGLDHGVIDPMALKEHDVIVFISHNHGDHYNRNILNWGETIPKLRLVLSDDIPAVPGANMIGANKKISQHDFTVETLKSNDEGVAFIVEIDGLCIYHAGDLNWWHWEGEPDDENEDMAASYKSQISLMRDKKIDLAFVPVDPRLEEQYAWGINYLMETVDIQWVVPMHFGNDGSIVDRLLRDKASVGYRDRVLRITERGAKVEI
jgi:L-ascorbate metabolism protein UlaG (beta-lactamase superfamily)